MAAHWFCKLSGNELGPLFVQQLRAMVAKGRLMPEHPIRQGAEGSWIQAGRLKGLFPADESAAGGHDSTDVPGKDAAAKPFPKAKPAVAGAAGPWELPVARAAPQAPRTVRVPPAQAAPRRPQPPLRPS